MALHEKITELRDEMGWTQAELAEKIDVHIQTLGRWERKKSVPDAEDIIKLAEVFNVTSDYLLFDNRIYPRRFPPEVDGVVERGSVSVPRDGRVDVPDLELLRLFEALCTLDERPRDLVKQFLKAFVFREELLADLSGAGEK